MTTDQLINKYPETTIVLAINARTIILAHLPNVIEMPDEKANIIGYGYSNKYIDQVCTIILSKKGIKIGFNRGTELPDPAGLLTGTGKVHKYVQVNEPNDLKKAAFKNLLKQGLKAWRMRTK